MVFVEAMNEPVEAPLNISRVPGAPGSGSEAGWNVTRPGPLAVMTLVAAPAAKAVYEAALGPNQTIAGASLGESKEDTDLED